MLKKLTQALQISLGHNVRFGSQHTLIFGRVCCELYRVFIKIVMRNMRIDAMVSEYKYELQQQIRELENQIELYRDKIEEIDKKIEDYLTEIQNMKKVEIKMNNVFVGIDGINKKISDNTNLRFLSILLGNAQKVSGGSNYYKNISNVESAREEIKKEIRQEEERYSFYSECIKSNEMEIEELYSKLQEIEP